MSFLRPIQWYHSHADPIWPDGTFKGAVFCKVIHARVLKSAEMRCRGWNFKELQYCATNSGPPEVELRFCPWIILYCSNTELVGLTCGLLYVPIMCTYA